MGKKEEKKPFTIWEYKNTTIYALWGFFLGGGFKMILRLLQSYSIDHITCLQLNSYTVNNSISSEIAVLALPHSKLHLGESMITMCLLPICWNNRLFGFLEIQAASFVICTSSWVLWTSGDQYWVILQIFHLCFYILTFLWTYKLLGITARRKRMNKTTAMAKSYLYYSTKLVLICLSAAAGKK